MLEPGPSKTVTIRLYEDTACSRGFLSTEIFSLLYPDKVAGQAPELRRVVSDRITA